MIEICHPNVPYCIPRVIRHQWVQFWCCCDVLKIQKGVTAGKYAIIKITYIKKIAWCVTSMFIVSISHRTIFAITHQPFGLPRDKKHAKFWYDVLKCNQCRIINIVPIKIGKIDCRKYTPTKRIRLNFSSLRFEAVNKRGHFLQASLSFVACN